jgi:transposase InsO family protein
MPWKESSVMDERLRFVAGLLEGEQMSLVCREFGISGKTGYKIFDRYKEHGLEAMTDRSPRPVRYANQLPHQLEAAIVGLKRDKPHWSPRKIRELLMRRLAGDVRVPAKSTIHAVLDRHGMVKRAGPKRRHATGTPMSLGQAPNDLWCTDCEGEFKLGNKAYCYPLTVSDHASRYLLLCEALESTREDLAMTAFERLFEERGLAQRGSLFRVAHVRALGHATTFPSTAASSPVCLSGTINPHRRTTARLRGIRLVSLNFSRMRSTPAIHWT